jgi:nitroreductase
MSEVDRTPLEITEYEPAEMIRRSRAFYEDVRQRRSVRNFDERTVPPDVIENALRAAGTAPSGANLQPWHFVVVSDPAVKRQIREFSEGVERAFYEGRAPEEWLDAVAPLGTDARKPFLEDAPVLICIFLKKRVAGEDGVPQKTYYPIESVGIATGLLVTALHTCGLGTLTYTPAPMLFLRDILGRPEDERPYMILATGYPRPGATGPRAPKASLAEIASFVPPVG